MISELKTKNMKELHGIRKELGLTGAKGEGKEALITRIALTMQPGLMNELNKTGPEPVKTARPKPPIEWLTVAQVMEALAPYKDKIKLAFYDEYGNPATENARTWYVKNGPAEDSGTMSISLNWLKIKVAEIANARFPAALTGRSNTPLFL